MNKVRKSKHGSTMTPGFVPTVAGPEPVNLWQKHRNEGFRDMYWTAPYHWGIFNPDKLTIVTYTEGDVNTLVAPDLNTFKLEIQDYINWLNSSKIMIDEEVSKYMRRAKKPVKGGRK